ncbi:MAG: (Na+)-NQR maturation NqrM [Pseudobacteriovorax sp.]|nr:(Na+)-NQR maturation NqrM [Pseudobacteriovorax sp.]
METFIAVVVFALVIFGMAIGYIVKKQALAGSCGGLNNLFGGSGDCEVCGAKAEGRCPKDKK